MTERLIALDVDGVIADFNTAFIKLANKEGLGQHFPKTADEITEWYYAERELISSTFAKVVDNQKFWLDVPIYKDTPKPLPFTPVAYVTARPINSYVTTTWLAENSFPTAEVHTVKEGEDKLRVLRWLGFKHKKPIVFVDDKQETVEYLNANNLLCYCFDRGWNQTLDAKYPRIKSLAGIKNWEDLDVRAAAGN